jgi:hypothetical protein
MRRSGGQTARLESVKEVLLMGCNNGCGFGGNSCWWIIIILLLIFCCGGCGNSCDNGCGNSCGC